MSKTELLINPKEFGIEKEQAGEITRGLPEILVQRSELENEFKVVSELEVNEENIELFRDLRLRIRDNRTKGIEVWHKRNKEVFLRGGQFVDALKRRESEVNCDLENKLLDLEQHFENIEKAKILAQKLNRIEALKRYDCEAIPNSIGEMPDEIWNHYLTGAKANFELAKKAKEEAEAIQAKKDAEEKLHKDRKNAILNLWQFMTEGQKMMNFGTISQQDWLSLCQELDKKQSEHQEMIEAQNKENARLKKEAAEAEAKLKAETKAKQKAEKEIEDRKKAAELSEKTAKEDEERRIQAELSKGDEAKFEDLLQDLEGLKTKYEFKSKASKELFSKVSNHLDTIINGIKTA